GAVCPRYAAGSDVQPPPDIFSSGGKLHVALSYLTTVDDFGRTLFCYQTPDGLEAPTLHVQPGDVAQIDLTNMLPPGGDMHPVSPQRYGICGDRHMSSTSVNMHFHGLNVS